MQRSPVEVDTHHVAQGVEALERPVGLRVAVVLVLVLVVVLVAAVVMVVVIVVVIVITLMTLVATYLRCG
jgi:hypothetical protein